MVQQTESEKGYFGRCVERYNQAWSEDEQLMDERFKQKKYLSSLVSPELWLSKLKLYLTPLVIPIAEARKSQKDLLGGNDRNETP